MCSDCVSLEQISIGTRPPYIGEVAVLIIQNLGKVLCKCLLGIACFYSFFLFLFLRLYCINCALFFWLDTVKPLGTTKTLGISHPACLEASVAALCGQESRHRCKKRPNYGNINREPWPPRQKKLAPDTNTCTFDVSTTFRLLAPLT